MAVEKVEPAGYDSAWLASAGGMPGGIRPLPVAGGDWGWMMGLFMVVWAGVFLFGDSIPGVADAAHFVESITGGDWCQFNPCEGGDEIDLLTSAAVASAVTVVLKSVWWLLVRAGKAGQGREGEKDWTDGMGDD